jgi:hypothetical protein
MSFLPPFQPLCPFEPVLNPFFTPRHFHESFFSRTNILSQPLDGLFDGIGLPGPFCPFYSIQILVFFLDSLGIVELISWRGAGTHPLRDGR